MTPFVSILAKHPPHRQHRQVRHLAHSPAPRALPDEEIVQEALKYKVELIILGSHGRTGLKKLLMGSVTERVIGQAPCPVLVVKQCGEEGA